MAIAFRLLPQGINFGSAAFLNDLVEACGLRGQEFHRTLASPVREKKVRQRTTAKWIRLPLLHSCSGGVRKSAVHSP